MFVSFDVFDTLVCRLVDKPIDVFKLLEAELDSVAPESFAVLRLQAEELARRTSEREDVTLEEIYSALQSLVPHRLYDLTALMEAEIAVEVRLCVPRRDVVKRLYEYQKAGVRCVAISDMYLPRTAVERILAKCDIAMDEVYVSSEILMTKARGTLFDHVRDVENVECATWTHYGDNFHSDVASPISKGISAFHTPIAEFELTTSDRPCGGLTNSIVSGVVRSLMYGKGDSDVASRTWFQLGAEHTGPLSVLLCNKARQKALETNAKSIYFLARDGYVLKHVFDALYPDDRRGTYLAASRRMINFIQTSSSNKNLSFLSANGEGLTGYELLARIGVVGRGEDGDLLSNTIHTNRQAVSVLSHYESEILARAEHERGHVLEYLKYAGLFSGENSVLVDVGWFCSIQKSLGKLIGEAGGTGSLHGIYFGTNVPKTSCFDAEGLFYTNKFPRSRAGEIRSHIEVMELLFTAPEQSIVTVQRSGAGFDIIRMESDHEVTRIEAALKICEGALAFADAVRTAGLVEHLSSMDAVDHALARFERLVKSPGREITASIRAINHSVGFGGSRYRPFLQDCGSVRRPINFLRTYVHSYWREALRRDFSRAQRLLASKLVIGALNLQWNLKQAIPWRVRQSLKRIIGR